MDGGSFRLVIASDSFYRAAMPQASISSCLTAALAYYWKTTLVKLLYSNRPGTVYLLDWCLALPVYHLQMSMSLNLSEFHCI